MPYKDPEKRRQKAREYSRRWRASLTPEKLEVKRAKDREASSRWRAANRERHLENCRTYHAENRDEANARRRRDYFANWERERAYRDAWAVDNPDRRREAMHRHYVKYRERILARNKAWKEANPDRRRAHGSVRAARLRASEGTFTADEFLALCAELGGRCAYCGEQRPLTVDHDIPLSRGGSNFISNIVPACRSCNARKGAKTAAEFVALCTLDSPERSR
jgi:5-methylcytosine-specific restriction endonuclease McrA